MGHNVNVNVLAELTNLLCLGYCQIYASKI